MGSNGRKNSSSARNGKPANATKPKTMHKELSAAELDTVAGGHLSPEEIKKLHKAMKEDMSKSKYEDWNR